MADETTTEAAPMGNMGETNTTTADQSTEDTQSYAMFRKRIDLCKSAKREITPDWDTNVDYRRGKMFPTDSDQDRVAVNMDWPQTKAKHAALFSQVPPLVGTTDWKQFQPIVRTYTKALDKRLRLSKVDVAFDEMMPDVINKAGIAACLVGYEARTVVKALGTSLQDGKPVDLTQFKPEEVKAAVANGMIKVDQSPQVIDKRFYITRISPNDLLWPVDFTGSDFDDASWVGHTDTMTWAEAKNAFNLDDEVKDQVVGAGSRSEAEQAAGTHHEAPGEETDTVTYDEIFYWAHKFDPEEKYFKKLKRMVFVNGITKPVVAEDYLGQKFNEQTSKYIGVCKFPIRFLTLTYMSDECVPPSDSAISRPQVDELIRSRTQMVLNRDRSQPIRWYDVNRVAQEVQDSIMRGTYQGWVPVNGDGSRAVGEVARAMYPREDFEFDRVAKQDMQEQWQMGPNQQGMYSSGESTATEAQYVQSGFNTRIGQERARVSKCYLSIADVMAGLMDLYDDYTDLMSPEDAQILQQQWKMAGVKPEIAFTIRPDSTVLLDSEQRIQKLMRGLNLVGKSGFVDPTPWIQEICDLSGVDAQAQQPPPNQPEPVNVSVRSADDLRDPIFLALLFASKQAPSPQDLQAAMAMLQAASQPTPPLAAPAGPGGPVPPPSGAPSGAPSEPEGPPPPDPGLTKDWNVMPRVTKRPDEIGG